MNHDEDEAAFLRSVHRTLQRIGVSLGLSPIIAGIQARRFMIEISGRAPPPKRRVSKMLETKSNVERKSGSDASEQKGT
jgi:hypothetical protein